MDDAASQPGLRAHIYLPNTRDPSIYLRDSPIRYRSNATSAREVRSPVHPQIQGHSQNCAANKIRGPRLKIVLHENNVNIWFDGSRTFL